MTALKQILILKKEQYMYKRHDSIISTGGTVLREREISANLYYCIPAKGNVLNSICKTICSTIFHGTFMCTFRSVRYKEL